jgi:hypothetical protein
MLMSALSRKPPAKNGQTAQDFTALVDAVRRVPDECAVAVSRTVHTTLMLRYWLIGSYIRDYEQHGADRAQYGTRLLRTLSDFLQGCLDRCYIDHPWHYPSARDDRTTCCPTRLSEIGDFRI